MILSEHTCKHGVNRLGDRGTPPVHDKLVPLRATGVGTDIGITLRADVCSFGRGHEEQSQGSSSIPPIHTRTTLPMVMGISKLCFTHLISFTYFDWAPSSSMRSIQGSPKLRLPSAPKSPRTWTSVTASTLRREHVQDTLTP